MRFAILLLTLGVAVVLLARRSTPATEVGPATATALPTPAEELRRIGQELYDGQCPQYGKGPRETFEAQMSEPALSEGKRMSVDLDLSKELLEAGEVTRCIALLEDALGLAKKSSNIRQQRRIVRELAQGWLREAENQNCVDRHNADCCIFPPRAGTLHVVKEPAEKARSLYQAVLADNPQNLGARWLINITTLLLGESLDSLPEDQRLPMRAFGEVAAEPRFRDVAEHAGVANPRSLAGGCAAEDFDGDGFIDILYSTCDPLGSMHYFHNSGDGTFEDRSEAVGITGELGGLNMIACDYDGDGDQDALVLRGGWLLDYGRIPKSLLRNDGGKSFVNVSREAGLWEPAEPTMAATFGDYDGDGDLDLYVGCESRVEIEDEPGRGNYPSQFFQNDGKCVFTNIAAQNGTQNDRYAKGVAAGDYDDDGDLDLYVSNIGFNRLYRNDGTARFEDVAPQAHVLEPSGRSFACWFFDYDEDGKLDIWVNAYAAAIADLAAEALLVPHNGKISCLYRNLGDGTFEDVAVKAGLNHPWLAMGANLGDVDNDGWQDVYLGTGDPLLESLMPNVLLHNLQGQRFEDDTAAEGLGHLQKGHGIAFADLDNDGDEDVFHKLGGFVPVDAFQNTLFENRTPPGNHWISLALEGTRTNRAAVGARIEVHVETPSGPRVLHRAAGSVSSFGGSPHELHIGLGDCTRITKLQIRWPRSSELQVFDQVPLDSWLAVREGDAAFRVQQRKSFHF